MKGILPLNDMFYDISTNKLHQNMLTSYESSILISQHSQQTQLLVLQGTSKFERGKTMQVTFYSHSHYICSFDSFTEARLPYNNEAYLKLLVLNRDIRVFENTLLQLTQLIMIFFSMVDPMKIVAVAINNWKI